MTRSAPRPNPFVQLTHAVTAGVAEIPRLAQKVVQAPARAVDHFVHAIPGHAAASSVRRPARPAAPASRATRPAPRAARPAPAPTAAAKPRAAAAPSLAAPAKAAQSQRPAAPTPTPHDLHLHAEAQRRLRDGTALEDLPPVYRRPYLAVERDLKGAERASRTNQNHARARDSIEAGRAESTTAAQVNRQIKEDKATLVAARSDRNPLVRGLAAVTDATSYGLAEKANDQIDGARAYYADRQAAGDRSWGTAAAGFAVELGDSFGVNRVFDHRASVAQTGDGITNMLITAAGGPVLGKTAGLIAKARPVAALGRTLGATRPGAAVNGLGRAMVAPRALPAPLARATDRLAATAPGRVAARVMGELEKPRTLPFSRTAAPVEVPAAAPRLVYEPPADRTQFHFGDAPPVRLKGYVATDADRAAFRSSELGRDWDYANMERTRPAGAPVLPPEEEAALLEYTGDGYRQLNKALWTNHPVFMAEQENMAKLVSSALGRVPPHTGVVYRGASLTEAQAAEYQVGQVTTHRTFSSSSTDVAKIAPYQSGNGVKMEYQIQSTTGRDLRGVTAHESEAEILFQPGTQFVVTGLERTVEAGGRPFMRVLMREI